MPYTFANPDDVPAPPAKNAPSRARYFHELLEELPDDKVAVIDLEDGQSIRGVKVSVGRVASSKGLKIQSWDDGNQVFVKKIS